MTGRTYEEATEALHAGREGRHSEHLQDKEPITKVCDELGLQPTVFYRVSRRIHAERDRKLEEARKQRQIRR
jgi:hypothetical protein